MAKKDSTEKEVLFEINDFKVYNDSVYRVKHKVDYDAPSGFVNKGISKIPGTGESFQAPFTGVSKSIPNSGRWDLGFHETSHFYKFESGDVVKKQKVKVAIDKVLTPYLSASGTSFTKEDFIKGNDEFFNNYRINLAEETVFNTSNPIDRFNLYVALLQRKLAPVGRESESTFSGASYAIENLSEKRTRTNVVAKNKLTASSLFGEIIKTDIAKARALMIYMGEAVADTTDEDILVEAFMERILTSPSKVETFLANYETFSTQEGEIELNVYNFLKKAARSQASKVTTVKGQLYYEDTLIGADIKSAAKAIANAKSGDFNAIQKEIIIGDEDN